MSELRLVVLVEGHGEEVAVPALVRLLHPEVRDVRAWRHPQGSLLARDGIQRAIEAISVKFPGYAIVLLLDCEDALPCELGPDIKKRVAFRPDLQVRIAFAYREFETWFLAGGLPAVDAHPHPESIRDAKGWLTQQRGRKYSPRVDQVRYVHEFDIAKAKTRSHSFARFCRIIDELSDASAG